MDSKTTMINKRQHLQQQYLIYGGNNSVGPMRGLRSELLKQSDLPPKRLTRDTSVLPPTINRGSNGIHNGSHKTLSQNSSIHQSSTPPSKNSAAGGSHKNLEPKSLLQKATEMKSAQDAAHKSKGETGAKNSSDKENSMSGRLPRKPRPPVYVPPLSYPSMQVPRNVVTVDTSKARGNTDVVRLAVRDLGWREFSMGRRDLGCDVIWNAVSFYDQPEIFSGQVNKFPGSLVIFHKVTLFRQLMLMKQLFPEDYDFFPRTWVLPAQFLQFTNDVRQMTEKKSKPKPTFIIKPSEGSQGEGIYLLRDPNQYVVQGNRTHAAQEYLSQVLLIDGYKFDLRVYCLVRRLEPLEVHVCNEGLARFSTLAYEQPTNKNLNETYMHLTNYSLNKRSATFNKSEKEDEGSKRKMTSVFRRMERMGHDTAKLWRDIEIIICKTMVAVAGELRVEYQAALPPGKPQPSCFQVLGFDILILDNLKPILLEVNSNPSLSITSEHEVSPGTYEYHISAKDEEVKRALIRDTLILMAPKNKYTKRRRRHRRRRHHHNQSEAMEVDSLSVPSSPVAETRHHRKHRERDITIRFDDSETGPGERQKSIFAENDKKIRAPYQRQETCRVFVEGEGEITRFPTPPFYHQPETDTKKHSLDIDEDVKDRDGLQSSDVAVENEGGPALRACELSTDSGSEEESIGSEQESCLKEIFPSVYGEEIKHMRVCERLADIFICCLGVKGCLRLGPTAFRMFARKCRLTKKGLNNASIDILYIDMQRKWEFLNPDRTSGLCFQGFVDACMELGRRIFVSSSPSEMLESFISYCEGSLRRRNFDYDDEDDDDFERRERLSPRILRHQRRSVTLFPRRTITSLEDEAMKDLFQSAMFSRQHTFVGSGRRKIVSDVDDFMREMRNKTYVPYAFRVTDGAPSGSQEDE